MRGHTGPVLSLAYRPQVGGLEGGRVEVPRVVSMAFVNGFRVFSFFQFLIKRFFNGFRAFQGLSKASMASLRSSFF